MDEPDEEEDDKPVPAPRASRRRLMSGLDKTNFTPAEEQAILEFVQRADADTSKPSRRPSRLPTI